MARTRPAAITAFGILNIVVGCLLLLCGVCGGLQQVSTADVKVNNEDVSAKYYEHMRREVPAYDVEKYADLGLRFVVALGFIASGAGLIMLQRWGHVLAGLVAGLSLLHQVVVVVWQLVFIGPAQTKFGSFSGFLSKFETIIVVGWAALMLIYNFGLIAALAVPSSFRAFWSTAPDEPPPQENHDYEDDEDDYDDGPRDRGGRRYS